MRHDRMLHPFRHGIIFRRHLPQRRNVVSVGQICSHAATLRSQFAQVHRVQRKFRHVKGLADFSRSETQYEY